MRTSENVTAQKMSVYWLTLLLMNGMDVYPGRKYKGLVRRAAAVYPWMISAMWTFIATSVLTSLMCRSTNYEETIEMLTYITGSSSSLALFVIGVYKRPQLYRMMHIARHEFWHDERRTAAHTLYSRFVRTYGAIMPVASVTMCTTPVIWTANYGAMNSPAALIFRMWTPWTQMTTAQYVAVYAVQFVVSLSVMISLVGMVFAMVVIVNEMQVQVDMIVDAVRDLDVWHASRRPRPAIDGLVECVKHHQTLIAYFNNFKSYFNLIFLVDIVYIVIMACLCASSLLLSNGFSAFHVKMMSLLTVVVYQFFFYCLIGEKFALMNKQFGDCVYVELVGCNNPKLSRIGVLIVLRTQKPLQLSAMGITKYSASLFTFSATMRSTYAGLNVLYNSSKN